MLKITVRVRVVSVIVTVLLLLLLLLPSQTEAFAAAGGKKSKGKAKAKKRKGGKVVGNRGFGTSNEPPLEEVIAKFPTRIPPNAAECICPCGSGGLYKDCCSPFHNGEKLPASPLDVLRSRYTAFAWRMPKYTIDTTHPTCRDYRKDKVAWAKDLNRDGMFDSYDFISLEAGPEMYDDDDGDGDGDDEKNVGYIDFKVNLKANASNGPHLEGQEITIRELSKFIRSPGDPPSWSYASGEVTSDVAGIEDVKLNN